MSAQQEAYKELCSIIEEMKKLHKRGIEIAREHDLIFRSTSYDDMPRTEDPSRLEGSGWSKKYKDTDDEYPGEAIYEVWRTSSENC